MIPPALSGAKSARRRISAASSGSIRMRIWLGLGLGQHLDDVGGVVRVHLGEELGGLLPGQRPQDRRRLVRVELLEDLRDLLVRQPLEEDRDLGRIEAGDERRPFRGTDPLRETRDALAFALADQLLDLLEQGIGGRGRHGTALDGGAAERRPWDGDVVGPPAGTAGADAS